MNDERLGSQSTAVASLARVGPGVDWNAFATKEISDHVENRSASMEFTAIPSSDSNIRVCNNNSGNDPNQTLCTCIV